VIVEFLDVKNVLGFCVFCGCFPVVAKEGMCWRFFDSYVEIGLSVVVDRGRGSTTTNYEGLVMMVTCHSKMGQQGN